MSNNLETIKSVESAICNLDSLGEIVDLWNSYAGQEEYIYWLEDEFEDVIGKDTPPLEVARMLGDFHPEDLFFVIQRAPFSHELKFYSFEYLEEQNFYSEYELAARIVKAGKPTGIESIDSVLFKG